MELQPHQQRVIDESIALEDNAYKLWQFTQTEIFKALPLIERRLLEQQHAYMSHYLDILKQRISLWTE